ETRAVDAAELGFRGRTAIAAEALFAAASDGAKTAGLGVDFADPVIQRIRQIDVIVCDRQVVQGVELRRQRIATAVTQASLPRPGDARQNAALIDLAGAVAVDLDKIQVAGAIEIDAKGHVELRAGCGCSFGTFAAASHQNHRVRRRNYAE